MIYSENILLCIAIPLVVSLAFLRGSARWFALSFLMGMGVCLLSAYISGFVSLVANASADDTAVYFSPVIEEAMKLFPLTVFLYLYEPENDETVLLSVGLGAGFATFENCCYILSAGAESLQFTLVRGLAVGVMHVVSMLVLSMSMSLVRHFEVPVLAGIFGALSLSTTFHALYNLLVSEPGITSYAGFVLPLVTAAALYVPYYRMMRGKSDTSDG